MNAPASAVELSPPPTVMSNEISLAAIVASKTNPRKRFDPAKHAELTDSVKQHGVLQPILVRPHPAPKDAVLFELVAGERRYRAAKAAGLATIPVTVRSLNDAAVLEIQCIENLQRDDLHPLEEAEGYEKLLKCRDKDGKPYSADLIAEKVGKSRAYVFARLKLLALDEKCRQAFYDDKLNASTALLIARIPTRPLQLEALKEITGGRWNNGESMSFREAARHIHEKYTLRLSEAPFIPADAKLLPSAGACTACPKRTGNQPELFADIKSADVCTDPSCFAEKKAIHFRLQRDDAIAKGNTVISGAAAKKLFSPYGGKHIQDEKLVQLDQQCWQDSKNRTYAQILGKDAPPPTLVEHPESGELIKVLPKTEVTKLLKEKGVKERSSSSSSVNAEQRSREAKARLETKIRAAIFEAIHAVHPGTMTRDDGAVMAREFFRCTSYEYRKRIVNLWLPPAEDKPDQKKKKDGGQSRMNDEYKRAEKFEASIGSMEPPALIKLMLELAVVSNVGASSYSTEPATQLIAAAARFGVDAAKIRRELTAESKPAKPAKKAAKKKAAKKPPTQATNPDKE